MTEISAEQVLAVLQQRAQTDRLISEIIRAAVIEAGAITQQAAPEEEQGEE